jgi:hypothetical protein
MFFTSLILCVMYICITPKFMRKNDEFTSGGDLFNFKNRSLLPIILSLPSAILHFDFFAFISIEDNPEESGTCTNFAQSNVKCHL